MKQNIISQATNNKKQQYHQKQLIVRLALCASFAILISISTLGVCLKAKNLRTKRALYELSDGAQAAIGASIRTTFSCNGLGYGYYADIDNNCKVFHVCQSFKMSDGSIYSNDWSFFCANQTIFNQATLSCSHPEDAVPCENASDFYHVNDYFGEITAPSIRDSDLNLANNLISQAYGTRLSSSSSSSSSALPPSTHSSTPLPTTSGLALALA